MARKSITLAKVEIAELALRQLLECDDFPPGKRAVLETTASLINSLRPSSAKPTDHTPITYAPGIFGRDVWTESFSSSPDRVTKTWLSSDLSAVAPLEYLVYDCGYTQSDLQTYFSDASFRTTIFQNYQDVQKTAECSQTSLKLYEFTSTYDKDRYVMFYWLQPESNTRILDLMLAFPADKQADLQRYAQQIFPQLSTCN